MLTQHFASLQTAAVPVLEIEMQLHAALHAAPALIEDPPHYRPEKEAETYVSLNDGAVKDAERLIGAKIDCILRSGSLAHYLREYLNFSKHRMGTKIYYPNTAAIHEQSLEFNDGGSDFPFHAIVISPVQVSRTDLVERGVFFEQKALVDLLNAIAHFDASFVECNMRLRNGLRENISALKNISWAIDFCDWVRQSEKFLPERAQETLAEKRAHRTEEACGNLKGNLPLRRALLLFRIFAYDAFMSKHATEKLVAGVLESHPVLKPMISLSFKRILAESRRLPDSRVVDTSLDLLNRLDQSVKTQLLPTFLATESNSS
jgi:hypothetical protein